MARRRMFTVELIDSDRFVDLPVTAQMLYISLSMHADDEGFLSSAKRLAEYYGGVEQLDLLEKADFIIRFDTGVMAIVDWHLNNTIRKDRSAATNHQRERKLLRIVDGRYVKNDESQETDDQVATNCQPFVNHLTTQNRIEENRKENIIIDNSRKESSDGENAEAGDEWDGEEASIMINKGPSCGEIQGFIEQEGLRNVDATQFWSHYYLNGWLDKDGRPVKDWKALARSWNERQMTPNSKAPEAFASGA